VKVDDLPPTGSVKAAATHRIVNKRAIINTGGSGQRGTSVIVAATPTRKAAKKTTTKSRKKTKATKKAKSSKAAKKSVSVKNLKTNAARTLKSAMTAVRRRLV